MEITHGRPFKSSRTSAAAEFVQRAIPQRARFLLHNRALCVAAHDKVRRGSQLRPVLTGVTLTGASPMPRQSFFSMLLMDVASAAKPKPTRTSLVRDMAK